jgi:hypothetical protein
MAGIAKDLIGQVFGRLTVTERNGSDLRNCALWVCKCICGEVKTVRGQSLMKGHTKSCGCLSKEYRKQPKGKSTHGLSKTPEYKTWIAIKNRCLNKNGQDYERYGGRGISISEDWMNSFDAFYRDMGKKPSSKHSIDRIDNDLGYSKENCRWATQSDQCRNRSSNLLFVVNGVEKSLVAHCEDAGIGYSAVRLRLKKGMSIEAALSTPLGRIEYISGEDHCKSKLTEEKVRFIRQNIGVISQNKLAEMLGVSKSTVKDVQRNRSWKWI